VTGISCGDTYTGSYSENDFTIQTTPLDLTSASDGDVITLTCDAIDRPNRFSVYDNSNNLIDTTGWMGTAIYPGPWGSSLNVTSTLSISFMYDLTKTYELRVDIGAADPLSPISDSWQVSITCNAPDCFFEGSITQPLVVDENTEINIWFDDSGSMAATLTPLNTMRNTILRDCLVQFYNNDYDLYDQNVTVSLFSSKPSGVERTLFMLNTSGSTTNTTKVINLVFQDEASPYNADGNSFNTGVRTVQYDLDLAGLRATLDNAPNNDYYRGVVFRVNTGPNAFDGFRQFLVAVKNGTSAYSGTNGLSDKAEITYIENVTQGSTAQYYADQIITALNTLGYSLNLCGGS
jgi:hypothetical protein